MCQRSSRLNLLMGTPLILLLSDPPLQLDVFHLLNHTSQNLEPIQSYKPIPTGFYPTGHQRNCPNQLIPTQKSALLELKNNNEIIIKLADKGGTIVVMDKTQYKAMVMDIQNNHHWYRSISDGFLDLIKINYNYLIGNARCNRSKNP